LFTVDITVYSHVRVPRIVALVYHCRNEQIV
jgi:hypothetical protein